MSPVARGRDRCARVALLGSRESQRPQRSIPSAGYLQGVAQLSRWRGIVVATTARWLWVNERDYTADVCIVDEAWQMTYADLGGLGPLSAQVVLVGDPGQIAPVVTGDAAAGATGPPVRSGPRPRRCWRPIRIRSPGCGCRTPGGWARRPPR